MRWLVNIVVFTGVGIAMTDTFLRVMKRARAEAHARRRAALARLRRDHRRRADVPARAAPLLSLAKEDHHDQHATTSHLDHPAPSTLAERVRPDPPRTARARRAARGATRITRRSSGGCSPSRLGLAAQGLTVGRRRWCSTVASTSASPRSRARPVALWMPLAFVVAFLGALSICLPSFYFYTQLSGTRRLVPPRDRASAPHAGHHLGASVRRAADLRRARAHQRGHGYRLAGHGARHRLRLAVRGRPHRSARALPRLPPHARPTSRSPIDAAARS